MDAKNGVEAEFEEEDDDDDFFPKLTINGYYD